MPKRILKKLVSKRRILPTSLVAIALALSYVASNDAETSSRRIQGSTLRGQTEVSIVSGVDDVNSGCSFSPSTNEVYFGEDPRCTNTSYAGGFRFVGVPVNQGEQIAGAYIEFTVDGPYSNSMEVMISAEAADNGATLGQDYQPNDIPLTNSSAIWNITEDWSFNTLKNTVDISPVIQEVVNRAGWQHGNDINIVFEHVSGLNHRRVYAYERSPSQTAKLVIQTSAGAVCPDDTIANGTECRPVTYQGNTVIVGHDTPISSRAELEEIEKSFVRLAFSDFPEALFHPDSREDGQQIQDIRLANQQQVNSDFSRHWEFVVSQAAVSALEASAGIIGADAFTMLKNHANAANEIWANSSPAINRHAFVDRIVIVDNTLLSDAGGGWKVNNDMSFGWWANDELNGSRGFIPFDIDSRWGLTESWSSFMISNGYTKKYDGVSADYGLIHELTHHLPVGDNYVYNWGSGHGFTLSQPNGKTAIFSWSDLLFMSNDHMSSPTANKMTSPASWFIDFYRKINPKRIRPSQHIIYPDNPVYGNYFYDSLTISVSGLESVGVTDCVYLRQDTTPGVSADVPYELSQSSEYSDLTFANGECNLTIDPQQQVDAFPGTYIGLVTSQGSTFPLYVPRNLVETLYWANSESSPTNFTFNLQSIGKLAEALDYFDSRITGAPSNSQVSMYPSDLSAYMDSVDVSGVADAIFSGNIDGFGNVYIIEYQFPVPDPSPTPTPTPTPTPIPELNEAPDILTLDLPNAKVGSDYLATIEGVDNNEADILSFTVTGMPNGLTVGQCIISVEGGQSKIVCTISGRPTAGGKYTIQVELADDVFTINSSYDIRVSGSKGGSDDGGGGSGGGGGNKGKKPPSR